MTIEKVNNVLEQRPVESRRIRDILDARPLVRTIQSLSDANSDDGGDDDCGPDGPDPNCPNVK